MSDEFKHKLEEGVGKAKEAAGSATDDQELENEGRAQGAKANLKQAGDKAKDAVDKVKDALS